MGSNLASPEHVTTSFVSFFCVPYLKSSLTEWWAYTTHMVCPVYLTQNNFRSCIHHWCQYFKSPYSVHTSNNRSSNIVVGIVTGQRPERSVVQISGSKKIYFSSLTHRDWPWSTSALLFTGAYPLPKRVLRIVVHCFLLYLPLSSRFLKATQYLRTSSSLYFLHCCPSFHLYFRRHFLCKICTDIFPRVIGIGVLSLPQTYI